MINYQQNSVCSGEPGAGLACQNGSASYDSFFKELELLLLKQIGYRQYLFVV